MSGVVESSEHEERFILTRAQVTQELNITDGPFKGFDGSISEIDAQKGKLKVLVNMFGRETPVELDFGQVEKL